MTIIYGITGFKGHGKNTLAEKIADAMPGQRWNTIHFADPLKQQAMEIFGLSHQQVYDQDYKEVSLGHVVEMDDFLPQMHVVTGLDVMPRGLQASTPREILQFYGTEYVRSIRDTYWMDRLVLTIHEEGWSRVLVPDVRFPNEAQCIRQNGGRLIRVGTLNPPADGAFTAHASETEIPSLQVDMDLMVPWGELSLMDKVAWLVADDCFDDARQYDFKVFRTLAKIYGYAPLVGVTEGE